MFRTSILLGLLVFSPAVLTAQEATPVAAEPIAPVAIVSLDRPLPQMKYSPDGQFVVFSRQQEPNDHYRHWTLRDNYLTLRRVDSGQEICCVRAGWREFRFSPDSQFFVWSDDRFCSVVDCASGHKIAQLQQRNIDGIEFQANEANLVITSCYDARLPAERLCEVRILDRQTWDPVKIADAPHGVIANPLTSRDGRYLTGFLPRSFVDPERATLQISIWDALTGVALSSPVLPLPEEPTMPSIAFAADNSGLSISQTGPDAKQFWDIEQGAFDPTRADIPVHRVLRPILPEIDPKNMALLTDRRLTISDPTTGKAIREIQLATAIGEPYHVGTAASAHDATQVLANGLVALTLRRPLRGRLNLWDLSTNEVIETINLPHQVKKISLSDDAHSLALLSEENSDPNSPYSRAYISVWDWPTQTERFSLRDAGLSFLTMTISPDGKLLATVSQPTSAAADTTADQAEVKLWELTSGRELKTIQQCSVDSHCIAFSPDSRYLAIADCSDERNKTPSGELGAIVRLWNLQTFACEQELRTPLGQKRHESLANVSTITFSADGEQVILGGGDQRHPGGQLSLWNRRTGERKQVHSFRDRVEGIWWGPAAKSLYMASSGLWELAYSQVDPERPTPLAPYKNVIAQTLPTSGDVAMGHRADVDLFATVRTNERKYQSVVELVMAGEKKRWSLELPVGGVSRSVQFTPDGMQLLEAGGAPAEFETRLFDAVTGQIVSTLPHAGYIEFAGDGETAATIDSITPTGVTLRNVRNGAVITQLSHPGAVAVTISPYNDSLVSRSSREVRIWDLSTFANPD